MLLTIQKRLSVVSQSSTPSHKSPESLNLVECYFVSQGVRVFRLGLEEKVVVPVFCLNPEQRVLSLIHHRYIQVGSTKPRLS